MRYGFIGPAYRSQSVSADCQTCRNLYLELIESGQGKSQATLYCTPGLKLLATLANGQGRGLITAQGRSFAVIGTQFWELLQPPINRGTVVSDGNPVSLTSGPTQVLIASAGSTYVYDLTANSLTPVAAFDPGTGLGLLGTVSQVSYADGFFFALMAGSNQIQASDPDDATSWPGVSETQVSVFSDNVLAIYADHRILWVFGPKNIQPYFDSGNFPFPYDVIEGGFIEQGIAAPFSIAKLDNSIFWLGADERGQGIVWRANGYQPVRVSTHAIEYEFGTYATLQDAVCYAYQDQGHTFYVMNFPTASKTWVYDCATQTWHERGYWNLATGSFSRSRAGFHTFNYGAHLVLDPTNGNVYQQSIAFLDDAGNPIRRERAAPHISNEQDRVFFTKMQLDLETGLGPTFNGVEAPTVYSVLDVAGAVRNLGISDNGIIQAPLNPLGDPLTTTLVYLNDLTNTTSWQITIDTNGIVGATPLAKYISTYPQTIKFVSVEADQRWVMQLQVVSPGVAQLQAVGLGNVTRGPQVTLEKSKDGGHSWFNCGTKDCGQGGEYSRRVIWNRLGSGRDTVFRISMTDAAQWRLIDAYLFTTETPAPSSRYSAEARERA